MAMASGVFGPTLRDVWDTSALDVDVDTDTFVMQLVTDTFTPNFNTHDYEADITGEVSGSGYTAPGKAMSGESITIGSGVWTFDASVDTQWTSASISSIRGRVIFDDTLTSDPLILATNFGADYQVTSGTLTIQENASGIWTIDYTP